MEQVKLEAKTRKELGKEVVKRERAKPTTPAIVYRKGERSVPLFLDRKSMEKALRTSAGENALINLKIEDDEKAKSKTCIIKEIQHDPLSGNILHVDFNEISFAEEISLKSTCNILPLSGSCWISFIMQVFDFAFSSSSILRLISAFSPAEVRSAFSIDFLSRKSGTDLSPFL